MAERTGGGDGAGLPGPVRTLIDAARRHRLGTSFLVEGFPESVAAIHGVHADIVHEARRHLAAEAPGDGRVPEESPPFGSTKPPRPGSF